MLVATAGQGVMRSSDDGATWFRTPLDQDIEYDAVVRAIGVHPIDANVVLAGADAGLVRSEDCGLTWQRVDAPFNDQHVWSFDVDPADPDVIVVGTGAPSRARAYRSTDGGRHWDELPLAIPEHCAGVSRPRITALTLDPNGTDAWLGVEEGGLWRSRDRGDSWSRVDAAPGAAARAVDHSDIHAISVVDGDPRTVVVVTVDGVWTSSDDGHCWSPTTARSAFGMRYTRSLTALAGGADLLLGVGDGTPGSTGRLYRSGDRGRSWQETTVDVAPNSTFWAAGAHPADPRFVLAGTKFGDLYRSEDAGATWRKEWREFSEITDLAWTPEVAPAPTGH